MPERIVDGLELIEVEVEHRQTVAPADPLERLLQLLAKQHTVGQIGQGVVMRQVGDPLV